jgi:hypothetical protein
MKLFFLALTIFAYLALPLAMTSCEKEKGPGEKIGEKIDDALDQRPGEKVKDAIEDAGDAVKDAVK